MSQYCYSPLPQKPNSIRLLQLLPPKDGLADLQGQLLDYTVQESDIASHPYEALSYVWGGDDKPQSIFIDNQRLPITQNLHAALLRLRDHGIPRIIWIDAVCINQTDQKEKVLQIQFMAAIFAKASRVIVWLGEAQHGSDLALESVRIACEQSAIPPNSESFRQEIQQLLKRSWFSRIWVLQEVAAARHILIMCGLMEIDGYAFCLGLKILNTTLEDSMCELLDIYHTQEATKHHDKIYALLGMSSDDLSVADLNPDYDVSWEMLMQKLVKFLLGNRVSVKYDGEIAVIKSKGAVLGHVSSVTTKQDNRMDIQIKFKYVLEHPKHGKNHEIHWNLSSSAKPIRKGDVICLLQGAQKPTIIRPCSDYFAIIMIAATPLEHRQMTGLDLPQSEESFRYDFQLVWNWKKSSENVQDFRKNVILMRESSKTRLESQFDKMIRIWNLAQILGGSGQDEKATKKEQEAIEIVETKLKEYLHTLESKCGLMPQILAARMGYSKILTALLTKNDVNLNLKDWNDRTPLLWAAWNGHEAVAKLLLKTGQVDVDLKDRWNRTPLSYAAKNGLEAVVKLLFGTGQVDVDLKDRWNRTPLSYAAENKHETVVKLLLETGQVDVDLKDRLNRTPLFYAVKNGHEAVVKLLLETGQVDVDLIDTSNRTPVSYAAENGHEAVVKLLLKTGQVNIDSKDKYNQTPLSYAAKNGHEAVVKLLLEMGQVDVNSKDKFNRTPLSYATINGHEEVVKLLLKTGQVNVSSKDKFNRTPLLYATKNGHEEVVKLLLETGQVDVNSKDEHNRTPVSYAAQKGHEEVAKLPQDFKSS